MEKLNIFLYKNIYKIISFFVICLFIIFTSYNHTIWRDEGHYIQIATELSFLEIITHSRVEGLIPTHPLILKLLYSILNNKILTLKLFNIFFYVLTFIILLRTRVPLFLIILFMISYPILTYGIINRHYILLIPPFIYLIICEKKSAFLTQLSFLALALTGIFGIFFLFCYLISNIRKIKNILSNNKIFSLANFTICCISFFYYTMPYDGRNWNDVQLNNSYFILKTWYKFLFTPTFIHNIFLDYNIAHQISTPTIINNILIIFSSTLIIFTSLSLYLKKENSLLVLLLSSLFIYLIFFSITEHHSYRHYSIFTVILFLINIKTFFINKKNINISKLKIIQNYKIGQFILIATLLISAILTLLKFNYSITKFEVANFYIIILYIFIFFTSLSLYLKKETSLLILLLSIFFIYLIFFSITENHSYKHYSIFAVILFLINIKTFFVNKKNINISKLKIFQNYKIGQFILIATLLISSFGSIIYAVKENLNIYNYSNSKLLAEHINKKEINCNDINSYEAWDVGSWLPYIEQNNCKIFQIKTNKTLGFWDLNFYKKNWNFSVNLDVYDFTKKKYTVFICETDERNCSQEKEEIILALKQKNIKHKIELFNSKTLGLNGEKFLFLEIIKN